MVPLFGLDTEAEVAGKSVLPFGAAEVEEAPIPLTMLLTSPNMFCLSEDSSSEPAVCFTGLRAAARGAREVRMVVSFSFVI